MFCANGFSNKDSRCLSADYSVMSVRLTPVLASSCLSITSTVIMRHCRMTSKRKGKKRLPLKSREWIMAKKERRKRQGRWETMTPFTAWIVSTCVWVLWTRIKDKGFAVSGIIWITNCCMKQIHTPHWPKATTVWNCCHVVYNDHSLFGFFQLMKNCFIRTFLVCILHTVSEQIFMITIFRGLNFRRD